MNEPLKKVSVIIPTYNSARFLPEALNSVLGQRYKGLEIVVVDDGSTDDTKKALRPFMERINYIYQENSGGPANPRNVGIQRAKGDYVAFLDSDDIMLPRKIEPAIDFLVTNPSLGMIFNNFKKFGENGNLYAKTHMDSYDIYDVFGRLPKIRLNEDQFILQRPHAFEALFYCNFIGTSGVVVPKSVFAEIGLFDETITTVEDRDMWFRIARSYDIGYLNMVGHYYRVRREGVSKRQIESYQARIAVMNRYVGCAKSDEARNQARKVVAMCYRKMAQQYRHAGDMRRAKRYYLQSMSEALSPTSLKGLLLALLGIKASNFPTAEKTSGEQEHLL